jgi:hypothetical protein
MALSLRLLGDQLIAVSLDLGVRGRILVKVVSAYLLCGPTLADMALC